MRTIDDLRRSFEQHADLAGAPHGLIQAAREGAVRIRRRRRMVRAGVSAAVVAVLAVTVPVVATRNLAEKPAPASPADRQFGQFTIELHPAPGYDIKDVAALADRQEMTQESTRPLTAAVDSKVRVVVYDPGVFNSGPLPGTEPLTIAGHAAWFQPAFPLARLDGGPADDRGPAVGWADPSGVQVVVYRLPETKIQKAMLLEVAEALRIGPPHDATVAFRLGWVPAGMEITKITVRQDKGSMVVLGGADVEVELSALPPHPTTRGHDGPAYTPLTVAGHPAFYYDDDIVRRVITESGTCELVVGTAAQNRFTKAELIRVLETLTVADCENPATWTRPDR